MKHARSTARHQALAWLSAAVIGLGVTGASYAADAPIKVVTSFSILHDIAREVGGDDIALSTLVGPDGDAHGYEPTPGAARELGAAQLVIVNGLGFETWLPRLKEAAGFKGTVVTASDGIKVRAFADGDHDHDHDDDHDHDHDHDHGHDHGEKPDSAHQRGAKSPDVPGKSHSHGGHAHAKSGQGAASAEKASAAGSHAGHDHGPNDPHAWQNLANGVIYTRNIADALAQADPSNAANYRARAQVYIDRLQALDAKVKAELQGIAPERRKVVTSHDAFGYFGDAYGITFIPVSGLSTSAEPSAKDFARIIEQVRAQKVPAVFLENISSPRLAEQIARETGAKMGGTLYSDALAAPGKPGATYIGMFEWNARQLVDSLR